MDPLARFFGSFTRLKVLRLFYFNDDTTFSFEEVVFRVKASKESVRKELKNLAASSILTKRKGKDSIRYSVNKRFVHFEALQIFLRTTTAIQDVDIATIIKRAGTVRLIAVSGIFTGAPETQVDILVVGDKLEDKILDASIRTLEAELGRELRFSAFSTEDFRYRRGIYDRLLRDVFDFPHRILIDKIGL
jgi:hypothetical protein